MSFPLTVSFHNTRRSIRAEADVKEHAERLEKFHARIQHCEVVIDQPHHHHNKGNEYQVRILLSVPGQQIVINSPGSKNGEHTTLHIAIRDAFEAARRQLRQHRMKPRKRRHKKGQSNDGAQDTGLPITA